MKHILRSYVKSKGLMYVLIGSITYVTVIYIGGRNILWTNKIIEYYNAPLHWLNLVIIANVLMIASEVVTTWFNNMGVHRAFTHMNNAIARKLTACDYSFFTDNTCSNIISTCEKTWKAVSIVVIAREMILATAQILIYLYIIYTIGAQLTAPLIVILLLIIAVLKSFYKKWSEYDLKLDKIKRARNSELDEIVNGFAEVRNFCKGEEHFTSITDQNVAIMDVIRGRNKNGVYINVIMHFVSSAIQISIILYCIVALQDGMVEYSEAIALVMYISKLLDPLDKILSSMDDISSIVSIVPPIAKLLEYENKVVDGNIMMSSFNSDITLENVSFSYSNGTSSDVLHDINLTIKKGQKIGICGTSGGGKSTLLKLIPRYYDPSNGSISIDGISLKDYNINSLRKHIGTVSQNVHIFAGTIYDNIIYANRYATELDVINACKKASIYDFIQSLPEKLQTDVGPRGLKLSGGQKQRIALARIFLENPDIIILDEATSALDNETEKLVQEALSVFKDKTVITVAHRLTTIKDSDCIIVLDNHTIAESGTHDELLKKGGIYSSLLAK